MPQLMCYKTKENYLDLLGICENATSILWTRSFYQGDTFKIRVPATNANVSLFSKYNVVELFMDKPTDNSYCCGIITDISIAHTVKGYEITATGTSPDGFLSNRILLDYAVGDTFTDIINKNTANERAFPATTFISADFNGVYGEAMRNKKLSEYVKQAGQFLGVGLQSYIKHNFVDLETGKYTKPFIAVEARKGVDRSAAQSDNKAVVFSDNRENATDFEYRFSDNGTVDAVYVYSESQINEASKTDVKAYNNWFIAESAPAGYERCEKVTKIQPVKKSESRALEDGTFEDWTVLDESATDTFAQNKAESQYSYPTEFFDCQIILPDNYNKYVDLGDIATMQNVHWGITADKRITEIIHFYNSNGSKITATFGEPYKSTFEILTNKQEG